MAARPAFGRQNCGVEHAQEQRCDRRRDQRFGRPSGVGVLNSGQTIDLLSNAAGATISGGSGGGGNNGGAGGAGLSNAGAITTLNNGGMISGDEGKELRGDGRRGLGEHGVDHDAQQQRDDQRRQRRRGAISGG